MGSTGKKNLSVRDVERYKGTAPNGDLVALYRNSNGDILRCIKEGDLYFIEYTNNSSVNKKYLGGHTTYVGDDKNEMNNLVKKYLSMGFKRVDVKKDVSDGSNGKSVKEENSSYSANSNTIKELITGKIPEATERTINIYNDLLKKARNSYQTSQDEGIQYRIGFNKNLALTEMKVIQKLINDARKKTTGNVTSRNKVLDIMQNALNDEYAEYRKRKSGSL